MFTGLVEQCVAVEAAIGPRIPTAEVPLRLEVHNPWYAAAATQGGATPAVTPDAAPVIGDSVAVDGVCLTVVAPRDEAKDRLCFEVGHETLQRTTLGGLKAGNDVHLERALAYGARVGGHLVSGHVDGCATLQAREHRGSSLYLGLDVPAEIAALSASQGSVTLAGVSLTLTEVDGQRLWVCLIPHTLEATHLGRLAVGARVNCEADLLARYLQRLLRAQPGHGGGRGV